MREGRHIDMDRDPVRGPPIVTEQNELPARVRRNGGDRPDPDRLVAELILPPVQSFICTEENVIGRFLVVSHDENRTGVSELEKVGILVNFLPGEPSITTQERVTVRVTSKPLSDVPDRHD